MQKKLGKYGWNYQIIWLHQIPPHLALACHRERIGKKNKIKKMLGKISMRRVY